MENAQLLSPGLESRSSHRLLIVDDSEIELEMYAESLAKYFNVSFASSAKEAWNQLSSDILPDAILLDIMMPNEDGLALCDRIKENQFTRDIPIIFLSSLTGPTIKSQAFEIGGADFISKPPPIKELVARISRHITVCKKTKRLESLIYLDPLTNLPNSSKFREVFKQEWSRCARYWHHLSLLLIRLDNMEQFAHDNGNDERNKLLAKIANELSATGSRPGDIFASLGNDTFALLLSDCSTIGAGKKADEILQRFNSPQFVAKRQENARQVDCTIGLAVAAPAGGGKHEDLFKLADSLLFESETSGTGKVYKHPELLGIDGLTDSQAM